MFTIGCEASWGGVTRPSQAGCAVPGEPSTEIDVSPSGLPTRSVPYDDVAVRKQQTEVVIPRSPVVTTSGSDIASISRSVPTVPSLSPSLSPSPKSTMEQRFIHRAATAVLADLWAAPAPRPTPAVPGAW